MQPALITSAGSVDRLRVPFGGHVAKIFAASQVLTSVGREPKMKPLENGSKPSTRYRNLVRLVAGFALVLFSSSFGTIDSVRANGLGENFDWQFRSTADKAAMVAMQDLIQKRKGGYYAAPVYNTKIDRQYNCNVAASGQGNNGSNSTVTHSPNTNGSVVTPTGNQNATTTTGTPSFGGSSGVATDQTNTGAVSAALTGSTSTAVSGQAWQALNSDQSNSGAVVSSVTGSTACTFGAYGALN
jgi:hypothetical protein